MIDKENCGFERKTGSYYNKIPHVQEYINLMGSDTTATLTNDGKKHTLKGRFGIALTEGNDYYPEEIQFQVFSKNPIITTQGRGTWNRIEIYLPRRLALTVAALLIREEIKRLEKEVKDDE